MFNFYGKIRICLPTARNSQPKIIDQPTYVAELIDPTASEHVCIPVTKKLQ